MKDRITAMSGRLTAVWASRREFAKRLREEDRGALTVEMVIWTLFWVSVATAVGAVLYNAILAKAHSFHL